MSSATAPSPDIPEQSWENPFPEGHPLHDLYARRVRNEQDLVCLIDDYHARRGTGKTVASLQLAGGMDQTEEGITWGKVSMSPEEVREAYANENKRSALVLDEGEVGASNREPMSKTNRALREIMSMGRVEQKYVLINTPSIGFIDKDIRLLADVWITMVSKGIGLIHYLERQPYANQGGGKLLTKKKGLIEFKDIQTGTQLRDVYNKLTREKEAKIQGEDNGGFIPRDEHEAEIERVEKEAEKETRDEILRKAYEHPEIDATQTALGDVVGLTQQGVGGIVGGNE